MISTWVFSSVVMFLGWFFFWFFSAFVLLIFLLLLMMMMELLEVCLFYFIDLLKEDVMLFMSPLTLFPVWKIVEEIGVTTRGSSHFSNQNDIYLNVSKHNEVVSFHADYRSYTVFTYNVFIPLVMRNIYITKSDKGSLMTFNHP